MNLLQVLAINTSTRESARQFSLSRRKFMIYSWNWSVQRFQCYIITWSLVKTCIDSSRCVNKWKKKWSFFCFTPRNRSRSSSRIDQSAAIESSHIQCAIRGACREPLPVVRSTKKRRPEFVKGTCSLAVVGLSLRVNGSENRDDPIVSAFPRWAENLLMFHQYEINYCGSIRAKRGDPLVGIHSSLHLSSSSTTFDSVRMELHLKMIGMQR